MAPGHGKGTPGGRLRHGRA
ncbi:hypothetical protein CCACVL1_18020 [Corchorus capsularis]|uniref:Uncharacterized protein n=1 Tax=Corchorus capsularis TaxID=210143 RepID=A0A1R3HNJ2_COCAP|nr:hypothetical protein CCACVL1_18020 [Corchorus capsularis]